MEKVETVMEKVETAFLVIKGEDGTYRATPYPAEALEVARQVTRLEIKLGCSEILDVIKRQDIVTEMVSIFTVPAPVDEEPEQA